MKYTKRNLYKLIAIFSMLIDHLSIFIIDNQQLYLYFRIIGRIALPVFAYQIAKGYIHTSNLKKYIYRLFILAIISQLPYFYFSSGLNIVFTLILALIFIYVYDQKKYLLNLILLIIAYFVNIEYGLYGLLLPFTFYKFKRKEILLLSQIFILQLLIFYDPNLYVLQYFSLPIILALENSIEFNFNLKINKYLFYFFYPTHLFIIVIIKYII